MQAKKTIAAIVTAAALALPVSLFAQESPSGTSAADRSSSSGAGSSASDRSSSSGSSSSSDRSSSGSSGASSAGRSSSGAGASGHDAHTAGSSSQSATQGFNEQRFIQHAISGNQLEIQLGQRAQQEAQRPDVKQFAQMMVQDHQQAQQQLQQLQSAAGGQSGQAGASARAGQSGQSGQLMPAHQAMLQEFQQLQGPEFERAYIVHQVSNHVKNVLKYRDASQAAQNDQVKSFASQALPKLQQHLQQAQQLAGWDESAITAGASEHGSSSRSGAAGHGHDATGAGSGRSGGGSSGSGSGPGSSGGSGSSSGTGGGSSGSGTNR